MNKLIELYDNQVGALKNIDKSIELCLSLLAGTLKPNSVPSKSLLSFFIANGSINLTDLIEFIGLLHQKRKEYSRVAETNERKHYGIYYTPYSIAKEIAANTIQYLPKTVDLNSLTFLEPCAGTGIFVVAYLDALSNKFPLTFKKVLPKLVNNIYCADIDKEAISLLNRIISGYIKAKFNKTINLKQQNLYTGDLLANFNKGSIIKIDPKVIFKIPNGFDIVLTNPPYKLLKANSNKYDSESFNNYSTEIKKLIEYFKKNKVYKYNEGTLNLYKLFVEEIVENYTNKSSKIGLLIPLTLLTDKQSQLLRKRIINNYSIGHIYILPEKNEFFPEITQAFCFFALDKSLSSASLSIKPNVVTVEDFKSLPGAVKIKDIKAISDGEEIILEDKTGWDILSKIHKNIKLKHINHVVNLRGELDLTLDKRYVTKNKTDYLLIKGINIKEFSYSTGLDYVQPEFISKINGKRSYVFNNRLVCQQISNIHSSKRLKFALLDKKLVLGNSCNFISITVNSTLFQDTNINLNYLLGLLNSLLLDWRFRLTNSNNHVGNYELGELPVVIPSDNELKLIGDIAKGIITNPTDKKALILLNICVFKLYKLTSQEVLHILQSFKRNEIANLIVKDIDNYDL